MPEQPTTTEALPVGTRVRHSGQQWPEAFRNGTGEILEVTGPDYRGDYEYLIKHDHGFSGREGTDREPSRWASYRTHPITPTAEPS